MGQTKRVRVSRVDFMRTWEETAAQLHSGQAEGRGINIVADRLGLKPSTVQQRVSKYRNTFGLDLTKMPRSSVKFNKEEALHELAEIRKNLQK